MTSVWTRKIKSDTPLPEHWETSLKVALTVYQGRVLVSLSQLTRDGGRHARSRVLWSDDADFSPATYGEAIQGILQAVESAKELLRGEGVG